MDGPDGHQRVPYGPGRAARRRWSSTAWVGAACSAPTATSPWTRRSRAGSRCTRAEPQTSWRSGSIAATCPPATAGASPPTTRSGSGVGSFDPRVGVKDSTVRLARDLDRDPVRYQGNWIPHKLREATEDEVFFAGDSAGHCLPLTAEGIRTAFYFGIACGRELRRVIDGRATRETALRRYAAFSARHEWQFRWLLRVQRLVPRVPPRLLASALRGMSRDDFVRWSFGHYLRIAHPAYARELAARPEPRRTVAAAA